MRFPLTVFALILLSGCNLPYRPPAGSTNIAAVRFSVPEAARLATNVAVYVLSGENRCSDAKKVRLLGGLQLGGIPDDAVDIGMLKDPKLTYQKNMYVEINVVADRRFNFAFAGHHGFEECFLSMSFLPKTGKQYEISYFTDVTYCHAAVSELSRLGELVQVAEETSVKQNSVTCKRFWN
jgi:hypothetical protein